LIVEPPESQLKSPDPSIYFEKLIFWVRVPSKQAHQTELFPALDPENGEK